MKTIIVMFLFVSLMIPTWAAPPSEDYVDVLPKLMLKYRAYEEFGHISKESLRYEQIVENVRKGKDVHLAHAKYNKDFVKKIGQRIDNEPLAYMLADIIREMSGSTRLGDSYAARNKIKDIVHFYMLHQQMLFNEMLEDPDIIAVPAFHKKVKKWAKEIKSTFYFDRCMMHELEGTTPKRRMDSFNKCLTKLPVIGKFHVFGFIDPGWFDLDEYFKHYGIDRPLYAMSPTGFIEGNSAKLYHKNAYSKAHFDWYGKHLDVYGEHGYLENDGKGGKRPRPPSWYIEQFKTNNPENKNIHRFFLENIYTEADTPEKPGFPDIYHHPAWSRIAAHNIDHPDDLRPYPPEDELQAMVDKDIAENPDREIFKKYVDAIRDATDTLTIDIFFLGGTLGNVIAKEVIKAMEKNQNLKVTILRDNQNHYGHRNEMKPVYNYLRAYSEALNKQKIAMHEAGLEVPEGQLIISSSELDQHESGLPSFVDLLIGEDFDTDVLGDDQAIMFIAKSDHSKIFNVDGRKLDGTACSIISSKNATDSSGGITWDKAVGICGPAANIAHDNYMRDIMAALAEPAQRDYLVQTLRAQGHRVEAFPKLNDGSLDIAQMTKLAIAPIDLLQRHDISKAPKELKSKFAGTKRVAISENNHDNTIVSPLVHYLKLINNAQTKIRIGDQYLNDKMIIDALIRATNERGVQVEIILTTLPEMGPMPKNLINYIHMEELLSFSKPGHVRYRGKKILHSATMAQEWHEKSIIVDDIWTINGSSNKDFMTDKGSFRETVVVVEERGPDKDIVNHMNKVFDYYFHSDEHTYEITLEDVKSATVTVTNRILHAMMNHESYVMPLSWGEEKRKELRARADALKAELTRGESVGDPKSSKKKGHKR